MPRPKTSGRDRKPATAKAKRGAQGDTTASPRTPEPSGTASAEVTIESLIRQLDETLKMAIDKERPATAVAAAVAIGRLLQALPDKPGRTRANLPRRLGRDAAPQPAKFDGNYNDAARRVALLLRLGAKEKPEDAGKAETANGQERDRPS